MFLLFDKKPRVTVPIARVNDDGRVLCQYCDSNVAPLGLKKKDGTRSPKKKDGAVICIGCWIKLRLREPNFPIKLLNPRGGIERRELYLQHRKKYCENKDGRLGVVCTYNCVSYTQLTVDHIMQDNGVSDCPSKNHPDNLQTLCSNCHKIKDLHIDNLDYDRLVYMMKVVYDTKKIDYNDEKVKEAVQLMIDNKAAGIKIKAAGRSSIKKSIKHSILVLLFLSFTLLPSCTTVLDPGRFSGEASSSTRGVDGYFQNQVKVKYKLWRF